MLVFKTEAVGDMTFLVVVGEVDVYTAPELRKQFLQLMEERIYNIVVDLRTVSFIDSTGLGALIGGFKRARLEGGYLELIITRPSVLSILEITGLTNVFVIHSSISDAIASRRA